MSAAPAWHPERYLAFGDERTRPAVDLVARVPLSAPARVADLGCGPGNATRLLCQRWPEAEVLGIDNSAAMLAAAEASGLRARWQAADVAAWTPDAVYDLLFANAALHWLPDHAQLLPRLLGHLRPGGVLALQMPRNFEAPSHALLRATAMAEPWASRLEPLLRVPVAPPAWYHDLLAPLARSLDIWETEYLHVLDGDDPVLKWTRSTALRPVLEALEGEEQARFEAAYAEALRRAYPKRADGRTLFPFQRLFIVATV